MSTFIICKLTYIFLKLLIHQWLQRFSERRMGGVSMKRSLDVAAIVFTVLLLLAFAALSLRGLIAPEQASARFGAPVADAAGSLFYRVYLSRNLVIVITGTIFLLTRQWTPLAILLTVTAALHVFDMP